MSRQVHQVVHYKRECAVVQISLYARPCTRRITTSPGRDTACRRYIKLCYEPPTCVMIVRIPRAAQVGCHFLPSRSDANKDDEKHDLRHYAECGSNSLFLVYFASDA